MKTELQNTTAQQILAEELAFHELRRQGYKVLLRNYECALGEIDLVAKEGGALVFISVNPKEKEAVKKVAAYYVKRYGIADVALRFDSVKVVIRERKEPTITIHKEDA